MSVYLSACFISESASIEFEGFRDPQNLQAYSKILLLKSFTCCGSSVLVLPSFPVLSTASCSLKLIVHQLAANSILGHTLYLGFLVFFVHLVVDLRPAAKKKIYE
jgi:hypothetical protein